MMYRDMRHGFTLVELMLSISFIAILLLAIAMFIIQISGIYNKGLTLREANQAGQFLSSEVQRSLNQTHSQAVSWAIFPDESGGRLCAGGIVYAWNYPGQNEAGFSRADVVNRLNGSSNVRFVKFRGTADTWCEERSGGGWESPLPSDARELLSGGDVNIALHSFSIEGSNVADDDTQTIYAVRMIVGTPRTGLVVDGNSLRCVATDKKDDEWCAVNEFAFTARSGNKEAS